VPLCRDNEVQIAVGATVFQYHIIGALQWYLNVQVVFQWVAILLLGTIQYTAVKRWYFPVRRQVALFSRDIEAVEE
jgi:hypothetical protein